MEPEFFPRAIPIREIKEDSVRVQKIDDDVEVAILKWRGEYRVLLNYCPHMGAPIAEGKVCKRTGRVQCPWHGYFFNSTDGKFSENPNIETFAALRDLYENFDETRTPNYRIPTFGYEVRDGLLYVRRSKKTSSGGAA